MFARELGGAKRLSGIDDHVAPSHHKPHLSRHRIEMASHLV
jgi:hypothetical protein